MASPLVVKVHPVVYLTIVDAYERRARPTKTGIVPSDKALGTLMGFYEKGAIQVTNCFAIPFSEQKNDVGLDDHFNQTMIQMLKRASPAEQPVGWFYTSSDLTDACISYHDYYLRLIGEMALKKEAPQVVLLTLDTTFHGPDEKYRMPVRAYLRTKAGIPGNRDPHCAIFNPLRVELDAFPGESVALSLVQQGMESKQREVELDSGLKQLEKSVQQMLVMLQRLQKYVDETLSKEELPADSSLGRAIMDVVTTASTHLQTDKLDALVKNSLRDYMMISYLAELTKTQVALHERIVGQ